MANANEHQQLIAATLAAAVIQKSNFLQTPATAVQTYQEVLKELLQPGSYQPADPRAY